MYVVQNRYYVCGSQGHQRLDMYILSTGAVINSGLLDSVLCDGLFDNSHHHQITVRQSRLKGS